MALEEQCGSGGDAAIATGAAAHPCNKKAPLAGGLLHNSRLRYSI
jgi:hypothetical protein